MEHARAFEPIQDDRIYIETINYPMIYQDKGDAGRVLGRLAVRQGAGRS
ncbi:MULTISPECIES: hypothetical protein [Bradyrhizobium]|jgi:hypothetical protein|nr:MULTISPECIES: hypothetical protein [Bradyrhizobium]MBR1162793.1 hypothetical protein [Bradyrhizobium elkanii]MCS3561499.1 hypothetical protein [Bradyrhizobium elkanii]MDI2110908.1 hypothetical protein [Bradyrhizobium sp. Mp64]WLB02390.1 hypothetical protein QNJ80_10605 [Bradyrhizobium elkanii]